MRYTHLCFLQTCRVLQCEILIYLQVSDSLRLCHVFQHGQINQVSLTFVKQNILIAFHNIRHVIVVLISLITQKAYTD